MALQAGHTIGGFGGISLQAPIRVIPGPTFSAPQTNASGMSKLPSVLGKGSDGDDMRGECTGDSCLTIALDIDGYQSAIWNEKTAECNVIHTHSSAATDITQAIRDVVAANVPKTTSAGEVKKANKKNHSPALVLGEGGITVVIPNNSTQKALRQIVVGIHAAGFKVKNIFRRGVATVTGLLSRQTLKTTKTDTVVVLFISSRTSSDGGVFLDTSLVLCEGGERAKSKLGFERLCTVAVGSKTLTTSPSAAVDELRALLEVMVKRAGVDATSIGAIICDGNDLQLPATKLFPADQNVPILLANGEQDAVRGGCMLSAAELESSKNYLQQNDGKWVLAFLLPVADGFASSEVGILTTSATGEKMTERAFSTGRLWKADIGPLKPGALTQQFTTVTKRYVHAAHQSGALSRLMASRAAASERGEVVKAEFCVTLMERASETDEWTAIGGKDIRPLQKEGGEVVASTLQLQMDPSTGLVSYTDTKGKTVDQMKSDFWYWVQLFAGILVLLLFLSSFHLYGYYYRWSLTRQHTAWLYGTNPLYPLRLCLPPLNFSSLPSPFVQQGSIRSTRLRS